MHLDEQVVTSSNIITAKALGAVIPFSYEIIKYLKDEDTALREQVNDMNADEAEDKEE